MQDCTNQAVAAAIPLIIAITALVNAIIAYVQSRQLIAKIEKHGSTNST